MDGNFCDVDDWLSEDDQQKFHPDVIVSFQGSA